MIHYEVMGDGLPLVFMHGLGGHLEQSRVMLEPLKRIQKILVDCPAHGKSDIPDPTLLGFDFMTDEILKPITKLNISPFLAGGISMGAGISMNMMVRYPELLSGAILIRPAWLDTPHPFNLQLMDISESLKNHPVPEKKFAASVAFQRLRVTAPNAAKSLLSQFDRPQGLDATVDLLHAMINDAPVKNLDLLAEFHKPVCIITNQEDPMHPAGFGEIIQEKLPRCELHEIFPKYLDPDRHQREAQEVIQKFISENAIHFLEIEN